MGFKKFMKTMIKTAMENGGKESQSFFDGMVGQCNAQAHNWAHKQAMNAMDSHMRVATSLSAHNMMHGPKF